MQEGPPGLSQVINTSSLFLRGCFYLICSLIGLHWSIEDSRPLHAVTIATKEAGHSLSRRRWSQIRAGGLISLTEDSN